MTAHRCKCSRHSSRIRDQEDGRLGAPASLLAATALLADYILTAAVGIFRGSECFGLGVSILASAHRFPMRGYSYRHHHPQSPRRARSGYCFRGSYLSVCWHTSHNDHRRRLPCSLQRGASHTGRSPSASTANDRNSQELPPPIRVSQATLRLDHRQTLPLLVRDGLLVVQVESRVGLLELFFLLYPRLKIRSSSYTPRRHFTLRGLHSTAGEAN
jgi:hypothetical protein